MSVSIILQLAWAKQCIAREILKQLSQDYETKIEVSRGDAVIRITADWSTCEDLLVVFILMLKRINCETVHVNSAGSKRLEKDRLTRIESFSNTIIRPSIKFGSRDSHSAVSQLQHILRIAVY